jgi:hypothetical protein
MRPHRYFCKGPGNAISAIVSIPYNLNKWAPVQNIGRFDGTDFPSKVINLGENIGGLPMSVSKRRAVIEVFGDIPVDRENLDFLYARRHCATVRHGKGRDLRYVAEYFDLEMAIWKTLDRIRKRDGGKIALEVKRRLVDSIAAK